MSQTVKLDLIPLTPEDIPNPESPEFSTFLDDHFNLGQTFMDNFGEWHEAGTKQHGTVKIKDLPTSSSYKQLQQTLNVKEYWCGRQSLHTPESVHALTSAINGNDAPNDSQKSNNPVKNLGRRLSFFSPGSQSTANGEANETNGHLTEVERQAAVMGADPHGLYERFRRGLLEYHSENEREYIESCREAECLQVFQPHVAEVWRLTYVTPPPTNPRTFVVLLLCRELKQEPKGQRCFMNISIPFNHPSCPEKMGEEKSRVRGKYVSVERVREIDDGKQVEWRMATSSDAGGNIPRFMTNSSLASSISEDVPSFLKWMIKRFPIGGEVDSRPVEPSS